METETASTATVEDGNGHIPSDVSMKEDLQAPRNSKVMGKENSRGDDTENEPEKSDAGKQLTARSPNCYDSLGETHSSTGTAMIP